MRTFIEHGEVWEIPAPAGGAKSGDVIIQGIFFGIAAHDAVQDDPLRVRPGGVHRLAAATSQAWNTLGAALYWDATNKVLTTTATGNTKVGFVWATKASADAFGLVKLNTTF